jgi:hypothetical protein
MIRQLLEPWVKQARTSLHRLPEDRNAVCYGLGHYGHWAMQAHDTAFSAYAVLAADPQTDVARTGMSRDELTATALAMLRFTLHSHHAGGGHTTDLRNWGHTWISALGVERMMHGVRAIRSFLTADDRDALRRVLLSEADWLLESWPVAAGLTKGNRPESNMWNGTFLHRVARLYPDAPQASAWREKGSRFLANAISIPEDAADERILDGRPLREWHVGPNFTSVYGCNHHGYMNVGYMVITLSNLAMFHFACREEGWTPPETLYLHARELWQVVKTCTFPDGRLWRIGGDSRVRYCYCQDYGLPAWLFAEDFLGDRDASRFAEGWLKQVRTEAENNGDGTFLGRRMIRLAETAPTYYYRLEGDKAGTLSMPLWWRRTLDIPSGADTRHKTLKAWSDDLHGASVVRSDQRLASWCWVASEGPQGMCLPPDASDMAEWRYSLSGLIRGQGFVNNRHALRHRSAQFDGGFATCGRVSVRTEVFIGEGDVEDEIAMIDLAFAALPDGRTSVGFQYGRLLHRAFLREVKGLHLLIPNDVHNGFRRRYEDAAGARELRGYPAEGQILNTGGLWLNVDGRLGVLGLYGGSELQVHRPNRPQVVIRPWKHLSHTEAPGGLLYADEICLGACANRPGLCESGTLFDVGFAVRAGASAAETSAWSQTGSRRIEPLVHRSAIRAALVADAEGGMYWVVAHFGDEATAIRFNTETSESAVAVDGQPPVHQADGVLTVPMEPGTMRVMRLG